ncbi:MAG: putative toxin-antitoxin system toxin component, PIN family [Paludibacteraceae bacterium]|nr:putative toxin-antitoxin system toxin component, PIN family [Paludibacteraceae bacterium]
MKDIVLDTNCLLMAISSKNEYHKVWMSFVEGDYVLCVSNEILEEYQEVIARNISPELSDAIIMTITTSTNVKYCDPHFRFNLITIDPDDNKFVDCAIFANASYIVSEDHHFDILKSIPFPKVSVIGIDEFAATL